MSLRASRELATGFIAECFFEPLGFYTVGHYRRFEELSEGRVLYNHMGRSRLFQNGGLEHGLFIVDEMQVGLVFVSDFF